MTLNTAEDLGAVFPVAQKVVMAEGRQGFSTVQGIVVTRRCWWRVVEAEVPRQKAASIASGRTAAAALTTEQTLAGAVAVMVGVA